jgi:hypothetical protein
MSMTKFCEGCPNRGSIQHEITSAYLSETDVTYRVTAAMGHGAIIDSYDGPLMVACDTKNNLSVPFKVPSTIADSADKVAEFLVRIVDSCQGPYTEAKGVFRRKEVIRACGSTALTSLSLHPSMSRLYKRQFEIVTLPDKFEQ